MEFTEDAMFVLVIIELRACVGLVTGTSVWLDGSGSGCWSKGTAGRLADETDKSETHERPPQLFRCVVTFVGYAVANPRAVDVVGDRSEGRYCNKAYPSRRSRPI